MIDRDAAVYEVMENEKIAKYIIFSLFLKSGEFITCDDVQSEKKKHSAW